MWTCPDCGRIFGKAGQPHSCNRVSFESHFQNKKKARELFDALLVKIEKNIGECKIIPLPCCIHLYGTYDFPAVLPKKDGIEICFALNQPLNTPRLKAAVPLSAKTHKNCFNIRTDNEFDDEFMTWIRKSYHLKD